MTDSVAPELVGPWPDGIEASRLELSRYIADVADGSLDDLPTRCEPWTGRDVTIHMAETFRRFQRTLAQGRGGDFTPPFTPDELDAENLRAVAAFAGDPIVELVAAAAGFLDAIDDLAEPVPHQLGTIPVGLEVLFGLMDLAMHHDDVLAAAGRSYQPAPESVDAILAVAERLFGMPPGLEDPWPVMVAGSGRLSA